ncbi:UDP-N-acetylmuramoyl-L-alanine--D-glutamate ligase [Candidatus Saccharibacteria bacterium]|nr:UDP-N-acetylmuramoyl-L-alanine--D-glutamate ligase [Candidatus Saccharibacteria bacterium]
MKIAILGYGQEGQAVEKYFKKHYRKELECEIFRVFTPAEIREKDFSAFDLVFRSPSVPPLRLANETSVTKFFFEHCPCPIIGVTATKGKGTTCSFIKSLLKAEHEDVYLVGNIGEPAINILDRLKPSSVVVYELSSFQLWDLEQSPHIAVIGHIEPDHLNIHKNYGDYLQAKGNICRYQTPDDYCIYYSKNTKSTELAELSSAHHITYPFPIPLYAQEAIKLPGEHNYNNAVAALAAVAGFYGMPSIRYLSEHQKAIEKGLSNTESLPHRLQFLRTLNHVDYYDDNFSTNVSSTRVAVEAFPNRDIILIVGGRDKTHNEDLADLFEITQRRNVRRAILIGESGCAIADTFRDVNNLRYADTLLAAVLAAQIEAEAVATEHNQPVVLMSPAAASFDMFENVYDRGAKYQRLVRKLR